MNIEIKEIIERLRRFAEERNWERFHSPKNLSMALSVEASEIMEIFQWMKEEESFNLDKEKLSQLSEEIADVMIYLLRLSDVIGIDPLEAVIKKIEMNETRYPAYLVKGRALKYSQLRERE